MEVKELVEGLDIELLKERRTKSKEVFGLRVGDVVVIAENTGYGYGRIILGIITEWNINGFWKVKTPTGVEYITKSRVSWSIHNSPHDFGNACSVVKICTIDELDLR